MEQGNIKQFSSATIALAQLVSSMEDEFFATRLTKKMEDLIIEYVNRPSPSANVAQSVEQNYSRAVESVLELLEELSYLKMASPLLLANAQHSCLVYKVSFINKPAAVEAKTPTVKRQKVPKIVSDNDNKLSSTQEKIFSFIKKSPNVRTKQIVEQFSVFSERTVKRSLKELVKTGLIQKRSENKAMFYLAL